MVYSVPLDIMTHHKQAYYRLHENAQYTLPIIALMKYTSQKWRVCSIAGQSNIRMNIPISLWPVVLHFLSLKVVAIYIAIYQNMSFLN